MSEHTLYSAGVLGRQQDIDPVLPFFHGVHSLAVFARLPADGLELAQVVHLHFLVELGAVHEAHGVLVPRATDTLVSVHILNVPDLELTVSPADQRDEALSHLDVLPRARRAEFIAARDQGPLRRLCHCLPDYPRDPGLEALDTEAASSLSWHEQPRNGAVVPGLVGTELLAVVEPGGVWVVQPLSPDAGEREHALRDSEYCTLVGGGSPEVGSLPPSAPMSGFPRDEPCQLVAAEVRLPESRKRSRERPFTCNEPDCEYRASQAGHLERHKRAHTGERPYACNVPGCEYKAAEAGNLERHKRSHRGERPFACDAPGCDYRANEVGHLRRHKRVHSGERSFVCDVPGCDYRAAEAGNLERHKRAHTGERPFACDEPGCEYRAAEASKLARHTRTHSGERPFACDAPGCEYRANEASHLERHKLKHSGKRPFACDEPGCEYQASEVSKLERHKRTHSGERPFVCDEPDCEYRASQAGHLERHKRAHTGERPYACNVPGCEYKAAEVGHLERHRRTHSGERPFACDEPGCEYRAAEVSKLERHKRTHSGERPYACDALGSALGREPTTEFGVARAGSTGEHRPRDVRPRARGSEKENGVLCFAGNLLMRLSILAVSEIASPGEDAEPL
ncbi:hypothetical protein T492DRAFT_1149482 [Pavlovales sp. CCMP2436]|nr:hypothetical protein T492DRAFT_1149482 [Pavlovales sp. CCMP2436]